VQLHCGTIEIRPAADISGMMKERERETFSEFALLHCFSYKRSRLSKQCHIDDEAIVYVAFQQPFVSLIDLLNGDQLNVRGDAMLSTEIEHLLDFADPANPGTGQLTALHQQTENLNRGRFGRASRRLAE
jgi:hypothetical protein